MMTMAEKKLALIRHIDGMSDQEVDQLYQRLVGGKKTSSMRQPISFSDIKRRFDVVEASISMSTVTLSEQ